MEDQKKITFIQILIKVEVEVVQPHIEVDIEAHMVEIINMKVNLMEVDKEILKEGEVIEVNNQTSTRAVITAENLGTWQRSIIKRNMMHGMESHNKGIMHQLIFKVMNNYLRCSTWKIQ
jgi:hypothetical protein